MISTMAIDQAQRRVNDFQQRCGEYGEAALHLTYHAALPVALNAELLHLLRINFFLDPPEILPYTVEFEFLLSPLCREIDEGLYEVEPEIRDVLLAGLSQTYDAQRTRDIATLLWQYVDRHSPWIDRVELERAQQLTALNFLNPKKAQQWLTAIETELTQGQAAAREWFVAMHQEIENQTQLNQAEEVSPTLLVPFKDKSNDEITSTAEMTFLEEMSDRWKSRLDEELSKQSSDNRAGIMRWLIGDNPARLDELDRSLQKVTEQAMDYRYRILQERYLGVSPDRAYRQLIQRLSSLLLIRNQIETWIALSRDRERTVVDVLQEVIQELLQNDTYLQQQVGWIAQCTQNARLRNALLLASTEEYCLRPIRRQPLLCHVFVNYLRHSSKGGVTQVPAGDFIRLVSQEDSSDNMRGEVSWPDAQSVAVYREAQASEEEQELQGRIQQQFEAYLLERKVDSQAVKWLRLYLQGYSQETIAELLNIPVQEVYRLREKINYHAVRVFAAKPESDLISSLLNIEDSQ